MSLQFEQMMELIKSDDLCAEELLVGIFIENNNIVFNSSFLPRYNVIYILFMMPLRLQWCIII